MSHAIDMTDAPARDVDPFTLEIIAASLVAIGDEMFVTTQRTSQTPLVYEILDFAVGLTDREGRMITQGNGIPLFLGTVGPSVRTLLSKFSREQIRPGDLFATNDPYEGGGTHLSDVTVMAPVFADGELIAFAANKAHWTDLGGKEPGTVSNTTREVFQEGLQLPCVRIATVDGPDPAVLDIIHANVRLPDLAIGDLQAQAASVRLADQRLSELCAKYGSDAVQRAIDELFARSRETALQELAKLPAGVYEAEDHIDIDGADPYRVGVRVTISSDSFTCDFTGAPPQMTSPMNCSPTGLESAVRIIFKALTGPNVLINDAGFEPLRIVCPPGTMFTARRPVPVATYWEVLVRIVDLVWKAVGPAMPDRATAGHYLSVACQVIAGINPDDDQLFIIFEPNPGGWGAGEGKDGERGLVSIGDGETFVMAVEVAEQRYGLLIDQYAFNCNDSGAGRWRGGEGVVKDFRVTGDRVSATGFMSRNRFPAWGVAGGGSGSVNEIQVIDPQGRLVRRGGITPAWDVPHDHVIRLVTGSGGGWGDPLERDPDAVARDVRNGFVTVAAAAETYGVRIDPESFAVRGVTPERAASAQASAVTSGALG